MRCTSMQVWLHGLDVRLGPGLSNPAPFRLGGRNLDDDEQDLADLMQRIDQLNTKQRRIIGGVVATLQAFDDDGAARRWLQQQVPAIRAELKRAR